MPEDQELGPPTRARRRKVEKPRNAKMRGSRQRYDEEQEILDLMPEDYDGDTKAREDYVPPPGRGRGSHRPHPGDKRRGSTVTLGQRWTQILMEVNEGLYTWDDFVRTLSSEELVRGQLKASNGTFMGRPPKLVPRAFYIQCLREVKRRFDEKMQDRLLTAADELIALSRAGGGLNPRDRAKTLQYLIERVMGPIPKEVHIKNEEPWEDLVVGIFGEAPRDAKDRYTKRREAAEQEEEEDE